MKHFFLAALLFSVLFFSTARSQVKILFDATKAETAGNADWVIDSDTYNLDWNPNGCTTCGGNEANPQNIPTQAQSGITSSTAETYWTGALSHWAVDCAKQGYTVETLPYNKQITYGSSTNTLDLSYYNIYVVDEPNILFTAAQKTAIMNFIINGGSLFMISDHDQSDRNNDGYDSPAIWNDLISNNGVLNNGFGFSVDLQNFSGTFTNIIASASDSIIHGPYGNVSEVQWSNGTSMTLNPSQNASVKGVVYKTGSSGNTGALVVYARVGCGKVAIIGDSSPPDDGTGDPNDVLYNGYITDAAGNHQKLLMNMMIWLAQKNCSTLVQDLEQSSISIFPNPSNGKVTVHINANVKIRILNAQGQEISFSRSETSEGTILDGLSAGVYTCYIIDGENIISKKLVVVP